MILVYYKKNFEFYVDLEELWARVCLDPLKFQKFYKIPRHIESLDACMKY
jgi:hypothetical protein